MTFNFPNAPVLDQFYTPAGGPVYKWDGQKWNAAGPVGASASTLVISDTPPANPAVGLLWFEADSGRTFVWYDDGDSAQWVQINATSGAVRALFDTASEVEGTEIPSYVNAIQTAGYAEVGDGGGALYKRGATGTPGGLTSLDGAGWELEAAANGDVIDVRQFGLLGSSDDTAALQALLDAFKGRHILIPQSVTLTTKGMVFDGATYDNSRLTIEGTLKLYPDPASTLVTGGAPVYCALLVRNCAGVRIDIPGMLDCNGAAHLATVQHMHGLVLAGATGFRSSIFRAKEIKTGDGIYITMQLFNTISTRTSDFVFDEIDCRNAVNGGRNALTIVDAINGQIGRFYSWNVGGKINGQRQPAGICYEANVVGQQISNIEVGHAYIRHQGTGGITCHSGGGSNIRFADFISINDTPPDTADQFTNITQASLANGMVVTTTTDFYARGTIIFENAYGVGAIISNATRPDVDVKVRHVQIGARIGADASDNVGSSVGVVGGKIAVEVVDCCRYGVQEGRMDGVDLTIRLHDVVTTFYAGPYGELLSAQNATHKNRRNIRRVYADYNANWTRLRRWDATLGPDMTDLDNVMEGGMIAPGYTLAHTAGQTTNPIREMRRDVPGVTNLAAVPTAEQGYWLVGQVLELTGGAQVVCTVAGSGGTWAAAVLTPGVQTLATDANFTLTPFTSPYDTRHTGTLTAACTVTLSTTGARAGQRFRITRTGTGVFPLIIGSPTLAALWFNEWCEVAYDGSAWYLAAQGGFGVTHQFISSDSNQTITPVSPTTQVRHTSVLTANRTVTLATTYGFAGQRVHIARSGADAFLLNVGVGPLKGLASNTWAEFVFDGAGSWYLAAYGAL